MSPHEAPHLNYPEKLWLNWFVDGTFNSDIDEIGAIAVLHYLIDLNILESRGSGLFKLSGLKQEKPIDEVRDFLLKNLNKISKTEKGFAVIYFVSGLHNGEFPPLKLENTLVKSKRRNIFSKKLLADNKSSDLSNLQIVKKWGDNLRPFLDLEQQTIARLIGEWTSKEDAQWLFSYILSKTRVKSPAKKWEQLSRKRHR